jgi:hypothetical protein
MEPQDVVALFNCLRLWRGVVIVVVWSRAWSLEMFLIMLGRWLRRIHSVRWRWSHLLVMRHPIGPKDHRLLAMCRVLI